MSGRILTLALLGLSSILLGISSVQAAEFYRIPLPADAREQARLEQKLPAVLHYYSQLSAAELATFYQQQLGQPIQQKQHQQQLQLYFQRNSEQIRVVIAEQQGWRDVSLMVEKR
ncbi:hypothetical protein AAY72_14160 [Alishewanella sp. WH16-1]|uniref:hypothetical protein n=1 Tax=Alishewanella sp. WH16-1 TaxID=1651088 RepID=UPI00070F8DD4|nr:hypothetical protein [Alishewanella sp. WH16-1]KRS20385.1 hypothetical protein AAY72_14160 [Alishewanella sp. WH16-1]